MLKTKEKLDSKEKSFQVRMCVSPFLYVYSVCVCVGGVKYQVTHLQAGKS